MTVYFGVDEAIAHFDRKPGESLHTIDDGRSAHVTLLDRDTVIVERVGSDTSYELALDALRTSFAGRDFRELELHEYDL